MAREVTFPGAIRASTAWTRAVGWPPRLSTWQTPRTLGRPGRIRTVLGNLQSELSRHDLPGGASPQTGG
jgi:hypothetical protein